MKLASYDFVPPNVEEGQPTAKFTPVGGGGPGRSLCT